MITGSVEKGFSMRCDSKDCKSKIESLTDGYVSMLAENKGWVVFSDSHICPECVEKALKY